MLTALWFFAHYKALIGLSNASKLFALHLGHGKCDFL
jgi:hypothetical protein